MANIELMQVAPSGDQICNQYKWRHLVAKSGTNASGAIQVTKFVANASSATWWPRLEPMVTVLHVGQIPSSQDYLKLLSARKLIQVEMLYSGYVVPLAMSYSWEQPAS